MKAIFFGDAHLGRKTVKEIDYLLNFIDETLYEADLIFILGDMFEFYYGDFSYEWFNPFLQRLRKLAEVGKEIFFLEGNHEFSLGKYFEERWLCKPIPSIVTYLDNLKVYISHGHEIKSSLLGRLLRKKLTYRLMELFGPRVSWRLAMALRPLLSNKKKGFNQKTVRLFRAYAEKKLKEGFDAIILAHSHIPDLYEIVDDDKRKVYLNTGDIIRSSTYGEYVSGQGFSLKKFLPGSEVSF
ncbi:MAG: UDP-2,3-diacylglucosamine diphosphatase [Desulfobacterota bacterium]|nr:UDP-2,3-diacylglucosamine diphosphatase [Thermodesulfobacteriota bacterium]MDW8001805.1 UDP-2,3-diacylglucosamine diphosphatase [Deltaproteobacteria bacterium]